MQQGITFETTSAAAPTHERPFPLDLVPRVLSGEEWRAIKRGLAQRIRALNHFVDDVYHAREIVREGIVPWRLVASCSHFARAVHGIRPPGGVYTHVAGCDLVRHSDGTWKVIEDNVRIPSGISYVLENRAAMARLVPELFASYRVRPVDHYPQLLLRALRSVAPSAESEATVVVWTPGPANPAYFEHAFLARQMGVELVEASDLVVRDDVLYMRTTRGLERAHAVYRRLDDDFVDPLEFRPDSLLGVPGLVRAYRAGSVAIANAFGTGVADDKAIYCFVPEMIRFYLGEEPILENVRTYLLSDPEVLEHVLERLDELVVKPTGESGGRGVMIGPHASDEEIERMRGVISAAPGTLDRPGRRAALDRADASARTAALAPRHVDLRPFAVFGERIDIVPGGLTRVALEEGSLIVNSSRGGGSKDTWVLEDGDDADRAGPPIADTQPPALPDLRYGAWTGQQQQQQQQPPRPAGSLMLARIAHELYWLGRNLARAEFTARAVEAVFQAELQGTSDAKPGVSFGSGGLLAMLGDVDGIEERQPRRSGQLTLDADSARLDAGLASSAPREGARTVRDVISAEMWEAINTTALGLRGGGQPGWAAPAGPVPRLAVRQGAHRADLGGRQPLDAPRRGQVLPRRRRADRDLRHGAAHAPGRAAVRRGRRRAGRPRADPAAGRRRLSRLSARRHRAAQRPPGRALPAVRARLPGQRRRVRGLAARGLHQRRRRTAQLQARAARQPTGRRPRLPAPRAARRRGADRDLRTDPAGAGPDRPGRRRALLRGRAPRAEEVSRRCTSRSAS